MLYRKIRALLESDPSVQKFYNRMVLRERRSLATFRRYMLGPRLFAVFMGAEGPYEALARLLAAEDRTRVLDDFVDWMIKRGVTPINLKALWFGIKKWLVANRVNGVDWDYISRPKVSVTLADRIPTKQELRVILDNKVSLRDKAFFLCAATSGLRIGTLASLKVGDFEAVEELGLLQVRGGAGRKLPEGKSFFTFITPEARETLEKYLSTRPNITSNSPLFTSQSGRPIPAYYSNISRLWRKLVARANMLRKIPGHWFHELHTHTLRKFFKTQCVLAGCRVDFVEFWMGHRPSSPDTYLNDSYFRPGLEDHLREYRKAVPNLTVFRETLPFSAEEVEKLKRIVRLLEMGKAKLQLEK